MKLAGSRPTRVLGVRGNGRKATRERTAQELTKPLALGLSSAA